MLLQGRKWLPKTGWAISSAERHCRRTAAQGEGRQHCGAWRPPLLRVVRRCRLVGVILRAHHSVCAQITVAEFESTPRRSYGSASSRIDRHGVGPVNRKRLIHLTWS